MNASGSLAGLFDPAILALLQETVSKVTGLAMSVLDAEGREVAAFAASSPLCRRRRRDKEFSSICAASDSYGADQAFARRDTFVYFCPCGLVRAVIPVIERGKYLGGVYVGQVRCENAPENIPRLERLLDPLGNGSSRDRHFRDTLEAIAMYDFSYFTYITAAIATVVGAMTAKEAAERERQAAMESEKAALEERIRLLERELHIRDSALSHWKARLNLEFLVNGLNAVAGVAAMEDSPQANEMCVLLGEHLRHYLGREKNFVSLREEFDMISGYLAMQDIRFGGNLSRTITLPDQAALCRVPSLVLLPFVESAVLSGLAAREEGYELALSASLEGGEVTIRIEDNAPMASGEPSGNGGLPMQSGFDAEGVAVSLATAVSRLKTLLGNRHELRFSPSETGSVRELRYSLTQLDGTV